MSDAEENVTASIDLEDYLPDGVIFAEEDFDGLVDVTVYVGQEMRRPFTVAVRNIHVTGLPAGLEAEIFDPAEECSITLIGLASELDADNVNTLETSVDIAAWMTDEGLAELEPGYYRMPLSISLPENSAVVWEGPEVQIYISESE